ncbi:MAG: hypothetical protein FD174_3506 [Geobacteraceae bacterium]|nr:MAG: hypothetical protein FD174_3506 [Geobacteraceae bacterium]
MSKCTVLLLLLAVAVWHPAALAAPLVKTGAQVLHDGGYVELGCKRVGLITNHTALVEGTHLIDLMHRSGKVRLAAIFAPEHGLRGLEEDGVQIGEGVDERTGVQVYSLYGKTKKPAPEMLRDLDLLVFDIQDIGSRFYTYISTMGLAMQAAAEAHIPFVVLDRPNPLGGDYVSGFAVQEGFGSFVGQYPIPVAHGLTIGELALMIKGERMLPGLEGLDLRVIRQSGWHRGMRWPENGLTWIRTSPNIPDYETALIYPGLCFLEATTASEGRGTLEPFRVAGMTDVTTVELIAKLNGWNLPGVKFESAVFTPRSIPGMCSRPKYRGRVVSGVRLVITNPAAYRPVETGVFLLSAFYSSLDKGKREEFFKREGFDRLAGTDILRRAIQEGMAPEEIVAAWGADVQRFEEKRRRYFLY